MRVNMSGDICLFCRHVRTPNLLLCDGHEPHISESIMAEFSGHQSDRLIIPGGCTSKLQPLDVSLKSMFHVSECVPISYQSILVLGLWQYNFHSWVPAVWCDVVWCVGGHFWISDVLYLFGLFHCKLQGETGGFWNIAWHCVFCKR
jgi:hypothetical protein